ncbi:MAG: hypothetical protein K0U98_09800 [Deltaproteobacteria bacterium]|nr:hypothetical protein [Deltaproteobacteria bacterium]
MTACPNWQTLLAHRFEEQEQLEEPSSWPQDVEHLEGCETCRIEALSIDPSLLFSLSMPEIEVGDHELQDMKRAVSTLRQGMELAARDSVNGSRPRRSRKIWQTAAAAAALATGLGYGTASLLYKADSNPAMLTAELVADGTTGIATSMVPTPGAELGSWNGEATTFGPNEDSEAPILPANWREAPVIEGVSSPAARVSFLTAPEEKLAVVMVIDPNLDV